MTIAQEATAYVPGFDYYHDNIQLLKAALAEIIRRTADLDRIRLLSLGIGHRYTIQGLLRELGERLEKYVIVEGSAEIISLLRAELELPVTVELIESYFEEYDTDARFDVIEMGFVLEHVDDPAALLRQFRRFLAPGGCLFISVPNAFSLHRQIGFRAGLMQDLHSLSPADLQLGHRRYFDPGQLQALVEESGLTITGRAGLMLKPFTSSQLASLRLSPEIWDALNAIAVDWPDLSNGILVEARECA